MESWCKIWQIHGFNLNREKQKLLRRRKRASKRSWGRRGSRKLFTLTIPWNLVKPVKISPGIIVRRHHTDQKQMGLLREQYAEWKKVRLLYCCNSGLDQNWWADSMECYTFLRNIQDILSDGKTPYERRFGEPETSWKRTTLLTDRAVELSTAKAYVFSDPVLCMGRVSENTVSAWKWKIDWFMNSSQCRELDRFNGEPVEFDWTIFPGFTALQTLVEVQNMMTEIECEPEQFPGRIIFMSMYSDIAWGEKRKRRCMYCEFQNRNRICKNIRARTLVVPWGWIRKEMLRNSHVETEWRRDQ